MAISKSPPVLVRVFEVGAVLFPVAFVAVTSNDPEVAMPEYSRTPHSKVPPLVAVVIVTVLPVQSFMFSAYHTLRYRDPVMVTMVDKGRNENIKLWTGNTVTI